LRLALTSARRPRDGRAASAPRIGIAAGAALIFAAAATLALGIVPVNVFHAAEANAQTLTAPPAQRGASGNAVAPR
jgi:hypothetical protein